VRLGDEAALYHRTVDVGLKDGTNQTIGLGVVSVRVGDAVAGRLKVVAFDAPGNLVRESGARFRATDGSTPAASDARVVGGSLEAANVSVVERMATLTEISRAFEGLQRGISMIANDLDGRAISEFGRR